MADDLPTFSSDQFVWRDGDGRASLDGLRLKQYPRKGFRIRSERTRQVRKFEYDYALNEAHEFYDGELMAFVSYRGNVHVFIRIDE